MTTKSNRQTDRKAGQSNRPSNLAHLERIATLDAFTQAYVECALWSSTDESTPSGGYPLDKNYTIADIDPAALAIMALDCRKFQDAHGAMIDSAEMNRPSDHRAAAGHDFWLTRNGHGCGFWDGDWAEPAGETLTEASKRFGECNLYVGDDGKVYVS
jgi:hypothetical protein